MQTKLPVAWIYQNDRRIATNQLLRDLYALDHDCELLSNYKTY
jgi:hypothetical protein